MEQFAYANPQSLKQATALLGSQWGQVDVLAGGTDLLNLMKEYIHQPKTVVNIKGIKELSGIKAASSGVRIGATTTIDELASSSLIRTQYASLHQAATGITSPQLRNMGTVGGDLCQRPRCWYFRNGFGLLGQTPEGKSLIPQGENKYHAIFPVGDAYFVSASSFGPALIALGAKLKLVAASGERTVDAAEFFVAPKTAAVREITLAPNEILSEILLPAARNVANATYEVRERDAIADWPLVTASVALTKSGSTVQSAKIVLGHVGPVPVVANGVANALVGKTISAALIQSAAENAADGAKALSGNSYKLHLAKVVVKRALMQAAGMSNS
jgi:xanthine dehydrogenase YagS FAD-binding subunit